MKVPEPRKLPSGNYFIRLRLNGVSVPITRPTAKECKRAAELIKAEYRADKRLVQPTQATTPREAVDQYIEKRRNTLSPSTIRSLRTIQKYRFPDLMDRPLKSIRPEEWQKAVDIAAREYSAKTLKNAATSLATAIKAETGQTIPRLHYGVPAPNERPFLSADEIPRFVETVAPTKYAVPLLLALSSMRISEIQALDWRDIPKDPSFVQVRGAVVFDEHNKYQKKKQNKNSTSRRNVPILIPALAEAIERERKPSGPVMPCSQNNLREACKRLCRQAGVTEVTPHGLRHSFASLAYHLQMPEQIAMEIGGWADPGTMRKIYTHIAQSDIERYKSAIGDFYAQPKP